MGGPQFEFRVAVGPQPGEIIVPPGEQIDAGKRLRVTAIESFGEPHNR